MDVTESGRLPVMAVPKADAAKRLAERDLQAAVVELARWLGWMCWHDFDSRRNEAGMPDLILLRGARLAFAELKSARGSLRPDQARWLTALRGVPGVEVHLWRPSHWYDGTIEAVLSRDDERKTA